MALDAFRSVASADLFIVQVRVPTHRLLSGSGLRASEHGGSLTLTELLLDLFASDHGSGSAAGTANES